MVYISVFAAAHFVIFFAIGMLGLFDTQFMFIAAPLSFLIQGTVIILMLSKSNRHTFSPTCR
ncbi:MptD family putative ECF transporter S component [Corynebacterium sp. HS2168-gen11]|uniref:MptD family putative ECF transporter S component n=1 Tax=Corynebacterium sp. HS2168-gen11 TaxID=2974027 RepID=UPI0037C19244